MTSARCWLRSAGNWARGLRNDWAVDSTQAVLRVGSEEADDCAVVELDGPCSLIVGSDYVRGVKFALYEMGLLGLRELGRYLAVANLSDLAAMGALPFGLLTAIRYPEKMTLEEFDQIFEGLCDACEEYGAKPIGGDVGGLTGCSSATALGSLRARQGSAADRSSRR